MRFSLRTLLIAMLLVGPLSALSWTKYQAWREEQARIADLRRELYTFTVGRTPIDPNAVDRGAVQLNLWEGTLRKVREERADESAP
jgi:hypothetical protein